MQSLTCEPNQPHGQGFIAATSTKLERAVVLRTLKQAPSGLLAGVAPAKWAPLLFGCPKTVSKLQLIESRGLPRSGCSSQLRSAYDPKRPAAAWTGDRQRERPGSGTWRVPQGSMRSSIGVAVAPASAEIAGRRRRLSAQLPHRLLGRHRRW